jgi:glycosyltransferase involved in cell wall biosynthesis
LRVSVGIPTRNSAATLPQAIESVLSQTLEDFELLISDNDSTDATASLVARYRDPRIRYHRHSRNLGYTRNVRFCIEQARAEIVAILCADDYWERDFLSSLLPAFAQSPSVTLAYSASVILDQRGSPTENRRIPVVPPRPLLSDGTAYAREELRHPCTILSGHLFRRSVALETHSFENPSFRLVPDLLHRLRVAARGRVAYVPRPLAVYRLHGTNLSSSSRTYHWWSEALRVRRLLTADPVLRKCPRSSLADSVKHVTLSLLCVYPDLADFAGRFRALFADRLVPRGCPKAPTETRELCPDTPPAGDS